MGAEEVKAPLEIVPGVARALSPLVRRIVASNAGPRTGPGTNSYLVGIDEIAVIDPGPADDGHLDALAGCGGDRVVWIVLTGDQDAHAAGADGLRKRTGAPVLGHPDIRSVDLDETLADGHRLDGTEFRLTAVHTPGLSPSQVGLVLEEEHMLFSGETVVEGSPMLLPAPDADPAEYLETIGRLRSLRLRSIAPGHGLLLDDVTDALDRHESVCVEREHRLVDALGDDPLTLTELTQAVFGTEVFGTDEVFGAREPVLGSDEAARDFAEHTVLVHLAKLVDEGRAKDVGDGAWSAA